MPLAASSSQGQLIFESPVVRIGEFSAAPEDRLFEFSGLPGEHLMVFPTTSVMIEHEGSEPFVADPNVVTFYNPDQVYFRRKISDLGDRSTWFAIREDVLRELIGTGGRRRHRLFPIPFARSKSRAFVLSQCLSEALRTSQTLDPLAVEENALLLGNLVIPRALRGRAAFRKPAGSKHRDLVEGVRERLAESYSERLTLEHLASEFGYSSWFICRSFRMQTGIGISAYRRNLRLRTAVVRLLDGAPDLLSLALDLGYSSHSHFTADFRRTFRCTPSRFRDGPRESPGKILGRLGARFDAVSGG